LGLNLSRHSPFDLAVNRYKATGNTINGFRGEARFFACMRMTKYLGCHVGLQMESLSALGFIGNSQRIYEVQRGREAIEMDAISASTRSNVGQLPDPDCVLHPKKDRRSPAYATLILLLLAFLAVVATAFMRTVHRAGSVGAAMAYLRGECVYCEPGVQVYADGSDGQTIQMENLTDTPVRIQRCAVSCPCLAISGLPMDIPPHGTAAVPLKAASLASRLVSAVFITDASKQPQLRVNVSVMAAKLPQ
jgi:hypothetical protein